MYNRYVRNDAGVYQRVPAGEPDPPSSGNAGGNRQNSGGINGFLSQIIGKLRLDDLDTGDLLLLAILFLLFRDGEDDELLLALGLLLIL